MGAILGGVVVMCAEMGAILGCCKDVFGNFQV